MALPHRPIRVVWVVAMVGIGLATCGRPWLPLVDAATGDKNDEVVLNNDVVLNYAMTEPSLSMAAVLGKAVSLFDPIEFLTVDLYRIFSASLGKSLVHEQLRLVEYCAWDNDTIDPGDYCRYGGEVQQQGAMVIEPPYTLVRFVYMGSLMMQPMGWSSLNIISNDGIPAVDPDITLHDVSVSDNGYTFLEAAKRDSVVMTVVLVLVVAASVAVIVSLLMCRRRCDRLFESRNKAILRSSGSRSGLTTGEHALFADGDDSQGHLDRLHGSGDAAGAGREVPAGLDVAPLPCYSPQEHDPPQKSSPLTSTLHREGDLTDCVELEHITVQRRQ